jgi:hypothetical protein
MEILLTLLNYLLPVIGSILALLLAAGAKKLLDKWGIERSDKIDAMLDKYIGIGVSSAEVAATKYLAATGSKMPGGNKKTKAIKVIMEELKQSGITNVAEELVSARIESWLLGNGHKPGVASDPE